MKTKLKLLLLLLALLTLPELARAQGTAFSYQGRVLANGTAANGDHDFIFSLFDAAVGGGQIGPDVPINNAPVANGQFNVTLDFGADVFTGAARWLEISIRPAGVGQFTKMDARVSLLPTPYAIFAATAANVAEGTVTAGQLNTGGVAPAPGQFLSYSGGNLVWSDPGVAVGNIWSQNGTDAYYNAGNVGIGTSTPTPGIRLEVNGATLVRPANGAIQFGAPNAELGMSMLPTLNGGNSRADLRFDGSVLKLVASTGVVPPSVANGITINTAGNVGIGGSLTPVAKLEVVAQDALRLIGYQPFLTLLDANAGYAMSRIQGADGKIAFHVNDWSSPTGVRNIAVIDSSGLAVNGSASVSSLTIRGGADLAEPFELSAPDVAKGSVVIIDDESPGKLKLSTRAYDTRVAGIVSGANGVNPGISLHQDGVLEGGQNVALSGRVYVLADAASGAIKPGDLLTTSDTPGHAMKVVHSTQSQGAILGKAMSGLKEGKGMVLVLVTLQ